MANIVDNLDGKFPDMTHGGEPNIRACRQYRGQYALGDVTTENLNATIVYEVPQDEICFYFPSFGTPHPECPDRFFLRSATVSESDENCAILTETYSFISGFLENNFDSDLPPQNSYSLRSSEFSQAIQLNDRFWEERPGPFLELPNSEYLCDEPGKLASWAFGFTGDQPPGSEDSLAEGMNPHIDPMEINAFPACHPHFGVTDYLESGAEWVCTEFGVSAPSQSDIGDLHVIDMPDGLSGATMGNWLYVAISYEVRDGYHVRTRTWRYAQTGWVEPIYGPETDP